MNESALLVNDLVVGGLLFLLGVTGFVVRRNLIVMFLCVEMMLQGVSLNLIGWSRFHGDWGGQMLVLLIIAVAAAEAGVALALILMLYQKSRTLDAAFWQDLREEGQPAFVDRQLPERPEPEPQWPRLSPAGVRPQMDEEEFTHRERI